jgi:hypothetical protein
MCQPISERLFSEIRLALARGRRTKEAMGEGLAGPGKPFVGVSGTLALALGGLKSIGTPGLPAGRSPGPHHRSGTVRCPGHEVPALLTFVIVSR